MKVLILEVERKYNSHKVNTIGTNLEITRCAENSKSSGSIGSSLDVSQCLVTSTVKANKKMKKTCMKCWHCIIKENVYKKK